jgi:hypothetical protein
MKCSQAHKRISEYIDGLLDESAVHQLEAHLEKCENCSGLLAEMTSLVKDARQMEKVQPSEGVWLSIRKELIKKEQQSENRLAQISDFFNVIKYPRGLAIATSALLLLIISTFIFYNGLPFLTNDPNDPMKVAHHHFEEAEKHYQIAINSLKKNMPDYEAKLPPDLLTVFNENLKIIDQSIQVCQAAIREHPDNEAANALLMACYKKKIELLNEIRNLAIQAG